MAAKLSHRCLVVDVAPHGHHEAAMFVVARLCVFAGPTSHASPSGSTGAGFLGWLRPHTTIIRGSPSLGVVVVEISNNKIVDSTFARSPPPIRPA